MKRLYFVLCITLLLVACGPAVPSEEQMKAHADGLAIVHFGDVGVYNGNVGAVYRVIDRDAKVVCWIFAAYKKGGISCLPLEQTDLPQ